MEVFVVGLWEECTDFLQVRVLCLVFKQGWNTSCSWATFAVSECSGEYEDSGVSSELTQMSPSHDSQSHYLFFSPIKALTLK